MYKMDMIWVAAATMIFPKTEATHLITINEILQQVTNLFDEQIHQVMIDKHLVSWEDRMADKSNPSRGGSRNRFLFRNLDGYSPNGAGDFRLYKDQDNRFDGLDKTGPVHPKRVRVPQDFHYLIEWYEKKYFEG